MAFSSVDNQCLRHVLLLALAGTDRRSREPFERIVGPVAA
jgi:hypothetical protein